MRIMMNKPEIDTMTDAGPTSIRLDLSDLDLSKIDLLEDTALQAIARELNEDSRNKGQSKHYSHHSYHSHGTAMW